MATYRVKKESGNFVTIHKGFIQDSNLSWKAKGLLLYLLSRPDDWQIYETELIKHTCDGLSSLKSGIKELEKTGYIERKRKRDDKGRLKEYEYEVFEQPYHMRNSYVGKTNVGNSNIGKTYVGKSHTTNNNSTNNNSSSGASTTQQLPPNSHSNVFNFYQENGFGMLRPIIVDQINNWIDDFNNNEDIVIEAFKEAASNNVFKWSYVNSILRNWSEKGVKSVEDINAYKKQHDIQKKTTQTDDEEFDNSQYANLF
ncbi:DnaD domain protein [Staphylococcus epidermidis]|uniref:DnaD domain protein n=1 Tax=Staphylococcus epidermidis TaxID=1282 RepID=UPI00187ACBDE|nr:DnaD domain protein [Staphylococcus epidermidis]MBE7320242.1 DnaD domain protein [Staphylococcus epidermidis]